ncbi:MAG: hypothetical protein LC118_19730 [Dehalococcoidia bacterium]|nr:hypothetical protein [Dehalococcoidia bacterium]
MSERTRFKFVKTHGKEEVESDAALAIFTAECVHGRPKTRLAVRYLVADDGSTAVFETEGEAGEAALRVFLGLCSARFGDDGFQVERLAASGAEVRR